MLHFALNLKSQPSELRRRADKSRGVSDVPSQRTMTSDLSHAFNFNTTDTHALGECCKGSLGFPSWGTSTLVFVTHPRTSPDCSPGHDLNQAVRWQVLFFLSTVPVVLAVVVLLLVLNLIHITLVIVLLPVFVW